MDGWMCVYIIYVYYMFVKNIKFSLFYNVDFFVVAICVVAVIR